MADQNNIAPMAASLPMSIADLAHEIASADLILVATITRVSDASGPVSLVSPQADPDADRLCEAEVTILRTLAGEHDGGALRVFFLVGKVPSRPWMGLAEGQTLLLFLRSVDGGYVLVAPTERPVQTLPEIALSSVGASSTQAVAYELEQIILTADPISDVSLLVQATTARIGLQGDLNLQLLGTPALQDAVRRMAWIAIALADGKLEVLSEVMPLFVASVPDATEALRSLVVQKVSEIRAPAARQQLTALFQNARVDLARASASALRQLHDPIAIPDLIEMLNNADLEVRYQAVMGLAELEPSVEAGPSFEIYRSDEAYYIQMWKHWWQSSGAGSPDSAAL